MATLEMVSQPVWPSGASKPVLCIWVRPDVLLRRRGIRFTERQDGRAVIGEAVLAMADGTPLFLVHHPRSGTDIFVDSAYDLERAKAGAFAALDLTPDDLQWNGPDSDAID